jgi:hypothetical protein
MERVCICARVLLHVRTGIVRNVPVALCRPIATVVFGSDERMAVPLPD